MRSRQRTVGSRRRSTPIGAAQVRSSGLFARRTKLFLTTPSARNTTDPASSRRAPRRRARRANEDSCQDDDVETLSERTSMLNQFLLQLEAAAISDSDRLEVYRVQLELQMAQIAWNMAVFRQLSAQGQWEAAARFRTKANEGESCLQPIEKLIANTEVQIAEKAGVTQDTTGSSSVRMIPCSLCGVRNRVSPNAESFSCGICKNKNLMLSCQTCGTQAYECKALSGNVATYVCETCHRENIERRNGERRRTERRKGVPG